MFLMRLSSKYHQYYVAEDRQCCGGIKSTYTKHTLDWGWAWGFSVGCHILVLAFGPVGGGETRGISIWRFFMLSVFLILGVPAGRCWVGIFMGGWAVSPAAAAVWCMCLGVPSRDLSVIFLSGECASLGPFRKGLIGFIL